MSQDGAIVVVNVSDVRIDTICITRSSIQALPLPHLSHVDVQTWSGKALTQFDASNKGQKNTEYKQFLTWL